MRIEWDPLAVRDLDEIRGFIAADKPAAAHRVAQRIKTTVDRLSDFPRMGRQSREPDIRLLRLPELLTSCTTTFDRT
jgi:plasmid stabilization system protein ParE